MSVLFASLATYHNEQDSYRPLDTLVSDLYVHVGLFSSSTFSGFIAPATVPRKHHSISRSLSNLFRENESPYVMRKRHCRHNLAGHYLDPSASCVKALDVLSRRTVLQVDDRIQRFRSTMEPLRQVMLLGSF